MGRLGLGSKATEQKAGADLAATFREGVVHALKEMEDAVLTLGGPRRR